MITINLPLDAYTDDALTELNDYANDASVTIHDARIVNANDFGTVLVAFTITPDDWTRYAEYFDIDPDDARDMIDA